MWFAAISLGIFSMLATIQAWIFLYDRESTILWFAPDPPPPVTRGAVVGKPAWHTIPPKFKPACRKAFRDLWRTGQSQTWTTETLVGLFRVQLWRTDDFPLVAAVGIAQRVPLGIARLTAHDRLICLRLSQGRASKAIAAELRCARSTIDNRRASLARKLEIHPRQLVSWCGANVDWLA